MYNHICTQMYIYPVESQERVSSKEKHSEVRQGRIRIRYASKWPVQWPSNWP